MDLNEVERLLLALLATLIILLIATPVFAELTLAPNNTYVEGHAQLTPSGQWVGQGRIDLTPSGTYSVTPSTAPIDTHNFWNPSTYTLPKTKGQK